MAREESAVPARAETAVMIRVVHQPRSHEAEIDVCTVSSPVTRSLIILIILIIFIIFQVCVDLGIADHVWQDKRATIAQSVDNLDNQFRLAMRARKYVSNVYPASGAVVAGPAVGEGWCSQIE